MNNKTRTSLLQHLSGMGSHFSQMKKIYSRVQSITVRSLKKQDRELQRLGLDGPDKAILSKLASIQYLDPEYDLEKGDKSLNNKNIHNRDLAERSPFHHSNIFRFSQRQIWTSLTRNITRSLSRDF